MIPVVRNIFTDELYKFVGGNIFVNIRTRKTGEVSEEKARTVFKFNIEATEMINEYPEVENLIRSLNLKFDSSELLNLPIQ